MFAGFYLLAKIEEAADKPIYNLTLHILSGHTLKHLCAAMVPVFLTLMLAKREVVEERYGFFLPMLLFPATEICDLENVRYPLVDE